MKKNLYLFQPSHKVTAGKSRDLEYFIYFVMIYKILESEEYSTHPVTGVNRGNIYRNGACVNEVAETKRIDGGNDNLITKWYCIAFGGICSFNIEIGDCKHEIFTPFRRKLGPKINPITKYITRSKS